MLNSTWVHQVSFLVYDHLKNERKDGTLSAVRCWAIRTLLLYTQDTRVPHDLAVNRITFPEGNLSWGKALVERK